MTWYRKDPCSKEWAPPSDPEKQPPQKSKQTILGSYNWRGRIQSAKVPGSENLNNKKQTILTENGISPSSLSSPACQHNLRLIWVGSQPACPHSSPDPGKTVGKPINRSSQLQQPRLEIETHSWMLAMHWKISSVLMEGGGGHLPQRSFHCSLAPVCFGQWQQKCLMSTWTVGFACGKQEITKSIGSAPQAVGLSFRGNLLKSWGLPILTTSCDSNLAYQSLKVKRKKKKSVVSQSLICDESFFSKKRTDLTSVKLRDALPALKGCDETLRCVLRRAGAARDDVLHHPTRRAGVAGLVESGGLSLQPRHQQQVLGIHGQAAESLCLIMAGQNSLLPRNIMVMFLTPLLLWSHHCPWRHLGSQHRPPDVLRSDCSTHAGTHLRAPRNSGVVRHRQLCLLRIYKRHMQQEQPLPFSSLIGSKSNLAPRTKSWFSVKKFIGASYHFKYFNLSAVFCTTCHTSNVPKRLVQSDMALFTRSYIFICWREDSQKGFWADTNVWTVKQRLLRQLV